MNSKDLERFLAKRTTWREGDVDQRTRLLRAARMVPTGARGTNAPDISAEHAATVLLSLAVSDRAADAVAAVLTYAPLQPASGGRFDGFAGKETFADALTDILEDHETRYRIAEVVICKSWPMARISTRSPEGETKDYAYGAAPSDVRTDTVRIETRISGSFLRTLAHRLHYGIRAARWAVDDDRVNASLSGGGGVDE